MFKEGDFVVCISTKILYNLKVGEVYTVICDEFVGKETGRPLIEVDVDEGKRKNPRWKYFAEGFRLATKEDIANKMQKIMEE